MQAAAWNARCTQMLGIGLPCAAGVSSCRSAMQDMSSFLACLHCSAATRPAKADDVSMHMNRHIISHISHHQSEQQSVMPAMHMNSIISEGQQPMDTIGKAQLLHTAEFLQLYGSSCSRHEPGQHWMCAVCVLCSGARQQNVCSLGTECN